MLVFCLLGPTASGKTDLACRLTSEFPLEIVSVDSVMIYRSMNIGSAKPEPEVLQQYPHHLIDIIDPPGQYSAANFCHDVGNVCIDIKKRGKIPLLVGGTMLYFHALQHGLSKLPGADDAIRQKLIIQASQDGWGSLYQRLIEVDPTAAKQIHSHDKQRIQRALEVYELTKIPISEHWKTGSVTSDFQFANLLLITNNRDWLHQRIVKRFHQMMQLGLIDEVEGLLQQWPHLSSAASMRSVGYRQALLYLQGELSRAQLDEKGIVATRQLAKRQLTWLRRWDIGDYYLAEEETVVKKIMAKVRELLDN